MSFHKILILILTMAVVLGGCSLKSTSFSKIFHDFQRVERDEKPEPKKESIAVKEREPSFSFPLSIADNEFRTIRVKETFLREMQKGLPMVEVVPAIFSLSMEQNLIQQKSDGFSKAAFDSKKIENEEKPEPKKESIVAKEAETGEGSISIRVKELLPKNEQEKHLIVEITDAIPPPAIKRDIQDRESEISRVQRSIPLTKKTIEANIAEFEFVPYTPSKPAEEQLKPLPFQKAAPEKKEKIRIPLVYNRSVEAFIELFQNAARPQFEIWLSRSTKYGPLILKTLNEFDLPEELLYLALIESGFNPRARSPKKAVGSWQFMRSTARRYGLKINWWIDERRDIEKSTRAAARYLKYLYERFQNWELALAAYNAGEGKIARAIRRYRTRDYWKLRRYRYLSRETRSFVPKFMAAVVIANEPGAYGFSDLKFMEPLAYEEVTLIGATDLRLVAKAIDSDTKILKKLNPQLKRGYIPYKARGFKLKLPPGKRDIFLSEISKITENGTKTFKRHTIRSGESLSTIAQRYNTSIRALMDLNGLRNSHFIVAGKSLLVPIPSFSNKGRRAHLAKAASSIQSHRDTAIRKGDLLYKVRQGDTLWRIAKQYGLTVSAICKWNDIKYHTVIYPGDKLILRIGSL